MVRTVARRTKTTEAPTLLSKSALLIRLKKWALIKQENEEATKVQNGLRDEMLAFAAAVTAQYEADPDSVDEDLLEIDEKGSQIIHLPSFQGPKGDVHGFKREARTSVSFDVEAAEKLAQTLGEDIVDRVTVMTPSIDQDEFYVLQQEGWITEAQLDALFEEKVNWAFKPV